MGLALYVLIKDAPFWLPTFLAWYFILRGGPRARRLAFLLWLPALLLSFLGPLAAWREPADVATMIAIAIVLGGLTGFWQGRLQRR